MVGGRREEHATMGEHVKHDAEGEYYRMSGNRPYETGGERAKQAGPGMEKSHGEKSREADRSGSFKKAAK